MSEKKKDSNELLNILMIIIGLVFVVKAILEFLTWAGILPISWAITDAVLSVFAAQGIISLLLGFWCLVSGIGMFREEEYAMGMGLVVLSIMGASGIMTMIGWIGGSFDAAYWPNYIIIAATAIGVLGFIWLLFTYKRYD